MPLTIVSSKRFADHVTPVGHPERPERAEVLQAVAAAFKESGGEVIEPRAATDDDLLRVHTDEHVDAIKATRGQATMIDEDTFTSPDSEEIARLGAGAVLTAVDRVLDGPKGSPAGSSRRSGSRDGLLPLQQHRRRRRVRKIARLRSRRDRRLRRASRQRH